jgi:hypothetical protein
MVCHGFLSFCEITFCSAHEKTGASFGWPRSSRRLRDPSLGNQLIDHGAVAKHRVISSSAPANSERRRAGNPKQSFPPSMAGSQKQLFSTGKQRNAVTRRPAKPTSRPKPLPSDRCVLLSTRSTGRDLSQIGRHSYIASRMASESAPAQPVRQGLCIMQILSDQEHVRPGECHFSPPRY